MPVEVGFYALVNKAHATVHHANLPIEMQYWMFGEIFTTVTLLDGLTVIDLNGKCMTCYNHFLEKYQVLLGIDTLWAKLVQSKLRWTLHQNWRAMAYTVCLLGTV